MKKKDKTQGVVFVLPKSKEFFGRISDDFKKTGIEDQPLLCRENVDFEAKAEIEDLQELKSELSKLSKLHQRLKTLLLQLDRLVKDDGDK